MHPLTVVSLAVVVALAVNTATQARLGKNLLVDFALLAQFHLLLEDIDLASQLDGNLGAKFFFPAQAAFHKHLLGTSFRHIEVS